MDITSADLTQTAVYWPSPVNDGYGGWTYGTPSEVACRWIDKTKVIQTMKQKELVSQAQVKVAVDLDVNGYLWLGTLVELATFLGIPPIGGTDSDTSTSSSLESTSGPVNPGGGSDPSVISGAFRIVQFTKTPSIGGISISYRRTAYL